MTEGKTFDEKINEESTKIVVKQRLQIVKRDIFDAMSVVLDTYISSKTKTAPKAKVAEK